MNLVHEVLYHVKDPLQDVEEGIRRALADASSEASEVMMHLAESGGKRIRPMLTILATQLFGGSGQQAVPVGVAAELIHMATLVHDDVIDHASMRRGRHTVNHLWGNQVSVLAGDAMLAKALVILTTQQPHTEIVRLMADMIFLMCEGEIAQHRKAFDTEQNEAQYFARIEKKTALFFAACCQSGALMGGADEKTAELMWEYGRSLGMAFQIVDDLLDLSSDDTTLGKPAAHDLVTGVLTLPVLHAIETGPFGDDIRNTVAKQTRMSDDDVSQVIAWVTDSGSLKYAEDVARHFSERAKNALAELPDNEVRSMLTGIADMALSRDF